MNRTVLTICTILLFWAMQTSSAQDRNWSFEIQGGVPFNIPTPLVIEQDNEASLRLTARYRAEPFRSPGYYMLRAGKWKDGRSWEIEFVHHKLFLDNMPDEVQEFSISHGYNILTVNRAVRRQFGNKFKYLLRLGAGVVVAHPENTVRGLALDQEGGISSSGYYISGPVLNITLAKRFYLGTSPLFINTEIKFNPSVSWVPVKNGQAIVWNLPFALTMGMGVDILTKREKY